MKQIGNTTTPLGFSFPTYSRALADVIRQTKPTEPFVIGITGPWGSGKTTLMEAILTELGERDFVPVRFNAWAYSRQDSIWRALFVMIVGGLRRSLDPGSLRDEGQQATGSKKITELLDDAEKALYMAFSRETPGEIRLDAGQIAKTGAKLALRFIPWGDVGANVTSWFLNRPDALGENAEQSDAGKLDKKDVDELWGVFKRDVVRRHVAQIQSMEQFRNCMQEILKCALAEKQRLLVLVDDVDRCLPEQGLEVFEAIKLYLDLPGSVFLIAMDQDVLQHALDLRYKQAGTVTRRITAELYAEKMIDVLLSIPPSDEEAFRRFAKNLPLADMLSQYEELINSALPRNPRTWQRFANRAFVSSKILDELAKERKLESLWQTKGFERVFIKLQLLNFCWPAVVRVLGKLSHLTTLATCVREAQIDSNDFRILVAKESPQQALRVKSTSFGELPESVWPLLDDMNLLRFLRAEPDLSQINEMQALLEKVFSLELPSTSEEAQSKKS